MPTWLRHLLLVVVFWSYVWLLGLVGGPSLHQLLEQRDQEQPPGQQRTEQQPSQVAGSEGAEDRVAYYTLWLTVFTAVLGSSTLLLWLETRHAGGLAYASHIRERRPWLMVELGEIVQEFNRSNWANVTLKWSVSGIGNAPATNAVLFTRLKRVNIHDAPAEVRFQRFVEISRLEYAADTNLRSDILVPGWMPEMQPRTVHEVTAGEGMPDQIVRHHQLFVCLCYRPAIAPEIIFHSAFACHVELVPGDHIAGITENVGDEIRPFNLMGINSIS